MPVKLTFNEIFKLVYTKPDIVEIDTIARDPIIYTRTNGVFRENRFRFVYDKNGKRRAEGYPDWSEMGFKIENTIYDDKDIKAILHYLDTENLWTKKYGNRFEYKRNLNNNSQPPKLSKNTRKRSVQNKNGHLLPHRWHRVSKNGKNSFEGPSGAIYNSMTRYTNKNNSRVRPQTYRRTEESDTWYILPDGSISWYPYKS